MTKIKWNSVVLLFLVTSCATSFHPVIHYYGYWEEQLEEQIYVVGFRGNSFTTVEKATHFVLYRCAELTIEKGFEYFTVLSRKPGSVEGRIDFAEDIGRPDVFRRIRMHSKDEQVEDLPTYGTYEAKKILKEVKPPSMM